MHRITRGCKWILWDLLAENGLQDRINCERFPTDNKISTTKGGPQFSLSMNMTRVIEAVKGNPCKRCIQFEYTCSCRYHFQIHCKFVTVQPQPLAQPRVIRFAVQAFLSRNHCKGSKAQSIWSYQRITGKSKATNPWKK